MIWEFFIPLICFLGLIAGIVLARISPEEMKPGKRYFTWLQYLLLAIIIGFSIYYSRLILLIVIGLIIGFFFRLTYLYLGIILLASFMSSSSTLILFSSLIFIFGLPFGTLSAALKKIETTKIILHAILFALPMFVLLIPSLSRPDVFFGLGAGLLLGHFKRLFL